MPTENQGSSRSSRDTRKEQDAASRQPTGTPEGSRASDESVDFGSYVSSTVRSSSELFGTPSRSSRRSRPAARPRDAPDSGNVAPASPVAPDTSDTTQGNASSTAQFRAAGQGIRRLPRRGPRRTGVSNPGKAELANWTWSAEMMRTMVRGNQQAPGRLAMDSAPVQPSLLPSASGCWLSSCSSGFSTETATTAPRARQPRRPSR